ncbi:uridine kinase family protein [Nocardioides mesophilus]|uniref:ATP-binding protein n=1 Tax=Nocardioides mesophilus TaxID=433659 RepID=A0A7G9RDL5_9ACTN|nr:ATP-binding protein [Nocardioides mesophilus]QNN53690.1 ATP-binding protein [Nocardioides mesophilus]
MHAKVIVLAGPSGSGKSRLCRRVGEHLGLPTVNLDDYYKSGGDPTLPMLPGAGRPAQPDWDHPDSWLGEEATDALERICRDGGADVPVYDISRDGRIGHRRFELAGAPLLVAEGIFAQEVVAACRARGILADALCVRNHPAVTFWRRLSRDLREHRKPPLLLVRRGLRLMREEPRIVAHAVQVGCAAMPPEQAFDRIRSLVHART